MLSNAGAFEEFPLKEDGINGGGRAEPPLENVGVLETVNCSSVGGLLTFMNGFGGVRLVGPNGLVEAKFEKNHEQLSKCINDFSRQEIRREMSSYLSDQSPTHLSSLMFEIFRRENFQEFFLTPLMPLMAMDSSCWLHCFVNLLQWGKVNCH